MRKIILIGTFFITFFVTSCNNNNVNVKGAFKTEYTQSDYYMWDAYKPYENIEDGKWGTDSPWYNPTTTDLASASCKDCPTAKQMVAYLKAGVYWDDNTKVTEGQKHYTIDGKKYCTGLWVKKKRYIENFHSETEESYGTTTETFTKLSTLTDEAVKNIRTSGEYFFLPASGYFFGSGSLKHGGTFGSYWLSSPYPSYAGSAYGLGFCSGYAYVDACFRHYGHVPMPSL